MTRAYVIADTQVRPGVPVDHLSWIAADIVRRKPDYVIHLGDHYDFPSLSRHSGPGSLTQENARYCADLQAGDDAFRLLSDPITAEVERLARGHRKRWNPRLVYLKGNHCIRPDRIAEQDPRLVGTISSDDIIPGRLGWEVHGFLDRVWIEGVLFSHFFQSSHSHHAIGGTIDNRLNKIGASFVQGHEQGFRYGTRIQASGATWHGLVAGSCYVHREEYRGNQGQKHWRGCVVLNEVKDGDYCVMPLTLSYYARKYAGMGLRSFMEAKYKDGDWAHLDD